MSAAAANNSGSPRAEVPALSSINLAALQNFAPEFVKTLSALRLSAVAVLVDTAAVVALGDLAEEWGRTLNEARAGHLDSQGYLSTQHVIVYHTPNVGAAVALLKSGLEARGLLQAGAIYTVEPDGSLLTFWPPTAAVERLDA